MTTLGKNPYEGLPETAFWRSAVADVSPLDLQNIYTKKFDILEETKIATAGSCFAQHISHHLRRRGYQVLDVEPAPHWLPAELHGKYGYSIYSARYGNIYTIPQLLQLAKEAIGEVKIDDILWIKEKRFYDALRPAVEPDGFETADELHIHRQFHVEKVKNLFECMDVFIFTLGLTEAWRHRRSGTVYPTAPGIYAGIFDAEEYEFVNYDYHDLEQCFYELIELLRSIRRGSVPNIILTVSPVPLTATRSGTHVLPATTYSKSILRTLAGALANKFDFVDYFPSYEIILNQSARGLFFEHNLRSVNNLGVEVVMRAFFASHKPLWVSAETGNMADMRTSMVQNIEPMQTEKKEIDVQCEEAILAAFGQ